MPDSLHRNRRPTPRPRPAHDLRNVAIVAHVDHGKTTLVDAMLRQTGRVPRQPGRRRPGHGLGRPRAREGHHDPRQADDGRLRRHPPEHRRHARARRLRRRGRALAADGRLGAAARRRRRRPAAADALRAPEGDGPAPAGHRGAQQDRSLATPARPRSSTTSTSCSWTSAPTSTRSTSRSSTRTPRPARPRPSLDEPGEDLRPLLDLLVEVTPPPTYTPDHPLQLLVTNLTANDYVGRMAVGRIWNGRIRVGQRITVVREEADDTAGTVEPGRTVTLSGVVTSLQTAHGIDRVDIDEAGPGDIVSVAGPARGDHRRHADRSRRSAAAAAARRRRADAAHDVRRQHLAAGRTRGQVRHQPPDQGPPREGGPRQRLDRGPAGRDRPRRSRSAAAASCSWPSSSSRCAARASS